MRARARARGDEPGSEAESGGPTKFRLAYPAPSLSIVLAPSFFLRPDHTCAIMRPTGGVIAAVATAVVATKSAHAFVLPARASSSWRTGAASQRQQQQRKDTCSAIDNRRFRRASAAATTALPASAPAQEAAEAGDEAAAAGGPEDAELSCSGVGNEEEEEEERPRQKRRWAAGARRSLLRGAASLATFTVGATALSGLSADLQHRLNAGGGGGATVVSMPGAMRSAEASVFKPFEKRTVEEKLANLPAFMVTNAKGSPYLSPTGANEPQVCMCTYVCRAFAVAYEEEKGSRGTRKVKERSAVE